MTILGASLRLYNLGYKSLWLDEARLFWIAQGPLSEVLAENASLNSAPPLFALLLNFVTRWNASEIGVRGIAWLAGLAAIPSMYFLARQLLPRAGALFCTFLLMLSSTQIQYSQEVREYSLTVLLAIFILASFKLFNENPGWKQASLLLLSFVLGVLAQYGLSLLLFALNLLVGLRLLARKVNRIFVTRWAMVQIITLFVVFWVYQVALKEQLVIGFGFNYLQSGYWDGSSSSFVRLAYNNTYDIVNFAYPSITPWIFFFLFVVGATAMIMDRRWLALGMFALPTLVTFLLALAKIYPYLSGRQVIFLLPMIMVVAGYGFSHLWRVDTHKISALVLLVFLVGGGYRATIDRLRSPGLENIKPLLSVLEEQHRAGDQIYVYYAAEPVFSYYHLNSDTPWITGVQSRGNMANYYQQLDAISLPENGRLWMIFTHCHEQECQLIAEHGNTKGDVRLVAEQPNAYLYLLD